MDETLARYPVGRGDAAPSLSEKVAFLSRPDSYRPAPAEVSAHETHMSWVFISGDDVYKMKKPVRFPYLDFSTLPRREAACRAEERLNRRLAPDIYRGVVPLTDSGQGLALAGNATPVEWLVHMRRLDERFMLDRLIAEHRLEGRDIDRLTAVLADFYRTAKPVTLPPPVHLAELTRTLVYNRRVLLDARFSLSGGLVRHTDAVLARFITQCAGLIAARCRHRRIVDGHGDLRPEHIWLGGRICIIDCLEFNARLRVVDPFDEIAYLSLECERLGAAESGALLLHTYSEITGDWPDAALVHFYQSYRAALRARIAIRHLDEEKFRYSAEWRRRAAEYLRLAESHQASINSTIDPPS